MAAVELIHGAVKASTLKAVLEGAEQIVVVSAFVTTNGLDEISKEVSSCVWRGGTATLLLGLDRRIASAELVRALGELLRGVENAAGKLSIAVVIEANGSFLHAKVFAARKRGCAELLVGSFNLTSRGLHQNHEFAARIWDASSGLFNQLGDFIESIPGKKLLTSDNVEGLASVLERGEPRIDAQVALQRRIQAQQRLNDIFSSLPKEARHLVGREDVAEKLQLLLQSGAFYNYQIDLKKLSVPSGLTRIYDAGLLIKEKTTNDGTFNTKLAKTLTASAPLVPRQAQLAFRRVAVKVGKALNAFGFETAYGYWVPTCLKSSLQRRVENLGSKLPSGPVFEAEVREFIKSQLGELQSSSRAVVEKAVAGGIQEPKKWKAVRDPELREIQREAQSLKGDSWRDSPWHQRTIVWMEKRIGAVREKLDADFAIGKLRRIRPDFLPLEIDLRTSEQVRRLLECMVWQVAEGRGKRHRPVVAPLLSRLRGKAGSSFNELQALSEALLEGVEGVEHRFFELFGAPPYWLPLSGDEIGYEEDDDLDNEGDDDDE